MHLLLDYDGVVLKNKHLTNYQYRRSARFVQKHTHMSMTMCEKLNKEFYPKYGHTLTMLNEMFKKNITLEEYNDFLYNKERLSRLVSVVDEETRHHAKSYEKALYLCHAMNINWHIFTNAHINWITYLSELIDMGGITEDKIIWPENKMHLLKPNDKAYERIENMLPSQYPYIFADDSRVNIDAVRERDGWDAIHVSTDSPVEDVVDEITGLIKSYDTPCDLLYIQR
jgi:hypothetical protein